MHRPVEIDPTAAPDPVGAPSRGSRWRALWRALIACWDPPSTVSPPVWYG